MSSKKGGEGKKEVVEYMILLRFNKTVEIYSFNNFIFIRDEVIL